jgi:hypothetical protein
MLIIEKVRLFTPTVNSNHRFDTALDFSICRGAISSRGRFNNPKWSTCFTKAATVFFLLRAKPVKNNRIFTRFFLKKNSLTCAGDEHAISWSYPEADSITQKSESGARISVARLPGGLFSNQKYKFG